MSEREGERENEREWCVLVRRVGVEVACGGCGGSKGVAESVWVAG